MFSSRKERYEVARYLALIVRTLAISLGFQVDKYGFILLDIVLKEIKLKYSYVELGHIKEIVEKDAQKRFEIYGDKIRAKTGHKYHVLIPSPPIEPPELLFHGTSPDAAKTILNTELSRMEKAYVHLSSTIERAKRIGLRKSKNPVILKIEAKRAFRSEVKFWKSGQISQDGEIFLSDNIPKNFISETCE